MTPAMAAAETANGFKRSVVRESRKMSIRLAPFLLGSVLRR
jgi:hypothetical protein